MQIKYFNSLPFLGGERSSKVLSFFGSGLMPLDEKIIPENAISIFAKKHFLGLSV